MKKSLFYLLVFVLVLPILNVRAEKVMVYIFTKEDDTISASTVEYIKELKNSDIANFFNYKEYVIWDVNWQENRYNRMLADNVAKRFDDEITGAPYIVIGSSYHGKDFSDEYKSEIKNAITTAYLDNDYQDVVKETINEMQKKSKKDTVISITIFVGIGVIGCVFIILSRREKSK